MEKPQGKRRKKPFDPIGTLGRHWIKIAVFGAALFIATAPVAMLFKKPFFLSVGKLRVSPVVPTFIAQTEEFSITAYYGDFVRTQVDRITAPSILQAAIESLPASVKPVFVPDRMSMPLAAELLARRLTVQHIGGTHLILLNISGDSPAGLAEMINRVMETYLAKIAEEEEGRDHRRLTYLRKEKERIEGDITQTAQLLRQLSENAATSTFLEMYNIHDTQLKELQGAYTRAMSQRLENQAAYRTAQAEAELLKAVSLQPLIDELVEKDQSLWDTSFWTYKTLQELRASMDGVSGDNPDRRYIEARMKGMQEYLDKLRDDVRKRADRIIHEKQDTEVARNLIHAKAAYEAAAWTEDETRQALDRTLTVQKETSQVILQGQQVAIELEHLRSMLNRIDERINELQLESRAPGRVSLDSLARTPERPSGSNLKKLMVAIVLLTFGGVTAVCVLFDLTDARIRSANDVLLALGAPPSWPISNHDITGDGTTPFAKVTLADPGDVTARAIHSLAIRLDRERREHDARVAVFTGVDARSGNTEILLNCAHAMTLLCARVLVVDTGFVRPRLDALTGGDPARPGMVAALAAGADVAGCIFRDPDRGIDVLPAGASPDPEAFNRIDRSRLLSHIAAFRKRYDFVLIDAPPLLISDFAEFLIVNADIAALVIQGDRSHFSNLYLAGEILEKLRVPAVAAVLNWGAPRYPTRGQVLVSRLLAPVDRMRIRYRRQDRKEPLS